MDLASSGRLQNVLRPILDCATSAILDLGAGYALGAALASVLTSVASMNASCVSFSCASIGRDELLDAQAAPSGEEKTSQSMTRPVINGICQGSRRAFTAAARVPVCRRTSRWHNQSRSTPRQWRLKHTRGSCPRNSSLPPSHPSQVLGDTGLRFSAVDCPKITIAQARTFEKLINESVTSSHGCDAGSKGKRGSMLKLSNDRVP